MFGDRWQLEELTVNYRTPSQIAEAAVRMANAAGLVVSAPKAVREGRWSPVVDEVEAGAVVSRLVEVLPEELEALDGGLLAVIADGDLLPAATSAPCVLPTGAASAPVQAATSRTSWSSAPAKPRAWSSTAWWCWNRPPC